MLFGVFEEVDKK